MGMTTAFRDCSYVNSVNISLHCACSIEPLMLLAPSPYAPLLYQDVSTTLGQEQEYLGDCCICTPPSGLTVRLI